MIRITDRQTVERSNNAIKVCTGFVQLPAVPLALLLLLMVAFTVWPENTLAQNEDFLIIVNSDVECDSIEISELKNIYMGTKKTLEGNVINKLVFLTDGAVHSVFMKDIIGRSNVSFRNYWKRRVFTGKNPMPRYFSSENSVVKYVQSNKNAIGYISAATPHAGVNVVSLSR